MEWPDTGTGNAVTYTGGCYNPAGSAARVGYLSIGNGNSGFVNLVNDPRIDNALYTDCDATEVTICLGNLGDADLSAGTSPTCGDACATPTVETSWGQIKALF